MSQTINQKLQQVQTKLKAPKGQRNNFGNYNYRSCEDILEAVKPLLAEVGACIILSDEILFTGTEKWPRFYVRATAKFTDSIGSIRTVAMAREAETRKGMDASQITGSASSYARKYALNGLFAIDDTRDADTMPRTNGDVSRTEKDNPETKAAEPTEDITEMIEQAFFNFETEWKDELAEGFAYDKEKFKTEIRTIFVGLTSAKKKTFKWTSTSIAKLAKKVDPSKVISEIKAA